MVIENLSLGIEDFCFMSYSLSLPFLLAKLGLHIQVQETIKIKAISNAATNKTLHHMHMNSTIMLAIFPSPN